MGLRITTWNVNGIRNPFGYQPWRDKKTFEAMFDILEADIVIMQELKIQRKDLKDDMVLVPGWDCFFSLPKHKKGYSGVGIYTRQSACCPIRAEEGLLGVLCPPESTTSYRDQADEDAIGGYLSHDEIVDLGVDPLALDGEGRCVVLEFPAFVLFGVYSPANSNGQRDDYRYAFQTALDLRIRKLDRKGKRVILTGDLNVSVCELDTAGAEDDLRKEGITHEEYISTPNRRIFNQLLEGGEVVGARDEGRERSVLWDVCRGFHDGRKGMYTHWEQKINARPGNYGSRIDYVLASTSMKSWFTASDIQEGLMGSDHCPVYASMGDIITIVGKGFQIQDVMNPPGVFANGIRLREVSTKDLLPYSARLLPEFNVQRRQNIKDMFRRMPSSTSASDSTDMVQRSQTVPREQTDAIPQTIVADQRNDNEELPGFHSSGRASEPRTPSTLSPLKPPSKRKSQSEVAGPKLKKTKSGQTTTVGSKEKGQGTLRAFFRPNAAISQKDVSGPSSTPNCAPTYVDVLSIKDEGNAVVHNDLDVNTMPASSRSDKELVPSDFQDDESIAYEEDASPTKAEMSLAESVESRIDSSEKWGQLFRKRQPPRCEDHDEPCISLQTKKKGFNCGREFWICPRPVGPSGGKEKNTQWRCRTFIWASDWNGGGV